MRVNGFHYILLCFLIEHFGSSVSGKTLFDNKLGSNNIEYKYPVKKVAPHPTEYSEDNEDNSEDLSDSDTLSQESLRNSRSFNHKSAAAKNVEKVKKRNLFSGHNSKDEEPFGVVFSHGKAIGVLKPLSKSYELSAFEGNINGLNNQVKREASRGESDNVMDAEERAFYNDKYPEVLANFKIGHRMQMLKNSQGFNHNSNPFVQKVSPVKLESEFNKRNSIENQNTNANSQYEESSANLDKIEDSIRGVISDLGLTEQEEIKEKRSAVALDSINKEDENLENGANKIIMRKNDHMPLNRKKKEDSNNKVETEKGGVKREAALEVECSTSARIKRDDKAVDKENIMNNLVTSGELTVSGNKSPLASSSNEHDLDVRSTTDLKDGSSQVSKEKRDYKRLQYEKEIEENIQQKINAIKEQVKREYAALKYGVDVKDQKKKRSSENTHQNTLIDEEDNHLSPDLNSPQSLIPHIRSKRDFVNEGDKEVVVAVPTKEVQNQVQKREANQQYNRNSNENCPKTIVQNVHNTKVKEKISQNLNEEKRALLNNQASKAIQSSNNILERVKDGIISNVPASHDNEDSEECPGRTNPQNVVPSHTNEKELNKNAKECPKVKRGSELKVKTVTQEKNLLQVKNEKEVKEHKRNAKESVQVAKGSRSFVREDENIVRDGKRNIQDNRNSIRDDVSSIQEDKSAVHEDNANKLKENGNKLASKRRRRAAFHKRYLGHRRAYERYVYPRVYSRRKRASGLVPEANVAYGPFRSEDDEVDDEGDEFDDDGFDDRTASLVRNRREDLRQDYYNPVKLDDQDYNGLSDGDYYADESSADDIQSKNMKVKRNSQSRSYEDGPGFDTEENYNYDNYLYNNPNGRRKRQNIEEYDMSGDVADEMNDQRVSKERQRQLYRGVRRKRVGKENDLNTKRYDVGGLTDADIFGALPQSYEGELTRFKRVKRSNAEQVKPSN